MDKFKNFIYDKSDLFVALGIILVAALIIWFGITNIMKPYSADTKTAAKTQVEEPAETTATPDAVTTPAAETQANPPSTSSPSKIMIKAGDSSDQIAEKLIAAGAITDKMAFYNQLESMGLASKIQEGTFEIPAGSNLEVVCKIITKTN